MRIACVLRHAKGHGHTYTWCGAGEESSKGFMRQMTENADVFLCFCKVWLCYKLVLC